MTSHNQRDGVVMLRIAVVVACALSIGAAALDAVDSASHEYLFHLPGIAGELPVDHSLLRGLRAGGYTGHAVICDWTENDPGLDALRQRRRNETEARQIAARILKTLHDDPAACITITSHSGGTGVAVWALEQLPEGVKVQTLLLLSSALSPTYDLSAALRHVRGKAYAFNSEEDVIVLSAGTRAFGTIDGVKCDAGGMVGFTPPPGADTDAYARLVQRPFERAWMKYGNLGDHIGTLRFQFAKNVLAPVVLDGLKDPDKPQTQPATRPARN